MSKEYRDTLNLPETDLSMKAGLPRKEPEILEFWNSINLYQKIREQNVDKEKFILHDGPPYANGDIHLGHAVNKILKDITIKFQSMLGKDAPYVPGWDCHGLPIELNVEKKYGKGSDLVRDKKSFIKACREYAQSQVDKQRKDFIRLGVLGDWENPYLSLNKSFEADTVRALGRIIANGHLEQGEKPVHFCMDCRSALAEAEVEYLDKQSHSIDVKFKVLPKSIESLCSAFQVDKVEEAYFVIWTTTPWTIPSNVAVCIHEEIEYIFVRGDNDHFIIAKDLLDECSDRWGIELEILGSVLGKEINEIAMAHPLYERESKLLYGDHVTTESGTGCVHTAPAHGLDDYFICIKNGLESVKALDNRGIFKEEYGPLSGLSTNKGDPIIIELLQDKNALLAHQQYDHSYPHCWRHKSPVIFMSTPQWFISMKKSGLSDGAVNAVKKVNWEPSWGEERILSMLEDRPDWCISRQRNWGVPITLIIHSETGEIHPKQNLLFNQIADVIEKEGIEGWDNLSLDSLIDDAESYSKVYDTLDVWFDSGVTHMCVLDNLYGADVVADLYLEGSDQHRGWFQSSLLTGIATNGMAPYHSVLTHGFVVDDEGRKQSKSLGNTISPQKIWDTLGADILRLWIASTDFRSEMVASDEIFKRVSDQYRRIRNTFRFLLGNLRDNFMPKDFQEIKYKSFPDLEKLILHKLFILNKDIMNNFKKYNFHKLQKDLLNFCSLDLSSFYFDIRKDVLYCDDVNSEKRKSCIDLLNIVLECLMKWYAPVLSFTTEEINDLAKKNRKNSIHEENFPDIPSQWKNEDLYKKWEKLLALRQKVNIAIEEKRSSKIIGSSLEADVEITLPKSEFDLLKEVDPKELFITSHVDQKISKANEINVIVKKAKGTKCDRCWKIVKETKNNKCSRCLKIK